MEKSMIDVPVLLIFFNRPDTFEKVFNQVKIARPTKLFLACDGARENNKDDILKIEHCKAIASQVDWDCEVYRNYQEKNLGCDPAEFAAISWGFENEEQLIVLEDDDVPSESFFYYCDELLDKYKDEKDVFMICGRNQLGETNYDDNSYFFTQADSIWGWASWRDRWVLCDYKHEFLNDNKLVKKIINEAPTRYEGKKFIERCHKHRSMATDTYVPSYESPIRAAIYLHDFVTIVPRVNLIKNVGISGDSEHTASGLCNIPKGQRRLYSMDAMKLDFPLVHPKDKKCNKRFLVERLKVMGVSSAARFFFRRVQGCILRNLSR